MNSFTDLGGASKGFSGKKKLYDLKTKETFGSNNVLYVTRLSLKWHVVCVKANE